MHTHLRAALLTMVLMLAACSAQPSAAPPTSVPAQPSPTRMKPTARPTATPEPMAALRAAIDRTKTLTTYRVTFRMGGGAEAAAEQLHFTGAFNGADSMFTYGGKAAQNGLPGDLEVIRAGGKTYAHGPLPVPGATESAWYNLGTDAPTATEAPLTIATIVPMVTGRLKLEDLAPDGQENLHGQSCTRYKGGLAAALGALDGTGKPTTPEGIAAEATPVVERMQAQGYTFKESEALVWVCPDGYLHQMRVSVTGEHKDQPQGFTATLDLEVTDPNGTVTITAPEGAREPGPALTASVYNGGNVREEPNLQGRVLDQVNAREQVALISKTADGRWFRILNERNVTGWVSVTLLRIDPKIKAQVPVAP